MSGLPGLALKGHFGLFRASLASEILGLEAKHILAFSWPFLLISIVNIYHIVPPKYGSKYLDILNTNMRRMLYAVIAALLEELITTELQSSKYSLLIDESTDIGGMKHLCLCVKYFFKELTYKD